LPEIAPLVKQEVVSPVCDENPEFDGNGRPLRLEDPENGYVCPCPDTALERAQRALRDMNHWALEGRRIDARHGLEDIERERDRDSF
jgi:hypothetical protein